MRRVGVLGLGSIGLRHSRNLLALGVEVFGFDPCESQQAILRAYGGIPAQREAVLSCDRLVIASPTPQHYVDLLEASCPTLAEKPLSDKPIDFDLSHIELVGYNLRYHACVKQARKWIQGGLIGKPLNGNFILAQHNTKPAYLRDGVTLNWSHEIDLCLYLLGPGSLLSSVDKNNTVSDLFIQHITGTVSSIHLNYINKKEERYFNILGSQGRISCTLAPTRQITLSGEDGKYYETQSYETTFDEDYVTEMKAFLSGHIGPGCSAAEAKAVLNICLGVL